MKQCKDCNEVKPLDAFKRHAETRDVLHSYCKTCCSKKQREYRLRVGNEPTKAYEKTVNGYLVRAYRNMKSRITGIQKKKFYLYAGKELMPKDEFYNWVTFDGLPIVKIQDLGTYQETREYIKAKFFDKNQTNEIPKKFSQAKFRSARIMVG